MDGFLHCMTMKDRDPWSEIINKRNAQHVGIEKIFVIFGNQNSGKTHTAWLVYNLFKNIDRDCANLFETNEEQRVLSYDEVLHHIVETYNNQSTTAISDFRAIIEINNKRVAIFSAGDYVDDPHWDVTSFVKNMKWAQDNGAKYVVCTARHYDKTHSVHSYLKEHYNKKIYKWYYKSVSDILEERLCDAENVAKQVIRDLLNNL